MSLPPSVRSRLEHQLGALDVIVGGALPEWREARPAAGEWSAREHLAHLARHATVFLARLERILSEESPHLGRYRAEDDAEWPDWSLLPVEEAVGRLRETRARLIAWATALSAEQLERRGIHPTFGTMAIPAWLEFFLLHEAHHLYEAMVRVGEARRRSASR